jgi:hypothetical protein
MAVTSLLTHLCVGCDVEVVDVLMWLQGVGEMGGWLWHCCQCVCWRDGGG